MKFLNYIIFFLIVSILFLIIYENKTSEIIDLNSKVGVDIKGYVYKPGYYELDEGSKVIDAIKLAGGLLEQADVSLINLSKDLKNEMVIIVYSKEEVAEMESGSKLIKYIEKECVCPILDNNACIDNDYKNLNENLTVKVSLNNATLEELMTLKGIGKSKAEAIIEYRKNNKFSSIEEITNVKGIGKTIFEKIKDQLTI